MTLPIEQLQSKFKRRYPTARLTIDRPAGAGVYWSLDFSLASSKGEVEWSAERGFGLSLNSEAVYGQRSDEYYSSLSAVWARLVELLDSGGRTDDSSEKFVRAMREGRKLTQTQLAKLLKVKQASVSRLECRADFHLSTLRNIVARLGGELELRASFPDGSVHILKYAKST